MRIRDIVKLYRARLRARPIQVQELLAGVGIAVGVALLFASQIASGSLAGSVSQLAREVVGRAQFELAARGPEGESEALLAQVRKLPVRLALPIVETQAQIAGPSGRRSIELIGANPRVAEFAGTPLNALNAAELAHNEALGLPGPLASHLGVEQLEPVHVLLDGRARRVLVGATLGAGEIGGLVNSPVAFAPIHYVQRWAGLPGRISRIFVSAKPGRTAAVRAGLAKMAAAQHLNLEPAQWESTLFSVAFAPQNQSETLFSAVCALVGFLLAANAILITVPARRRLIDDLRLAGASSAKILKIMIFDAAILAAFACVLGCALGYVLARTLFASGPGYLSFAFPVGNPLIVTWQSVLIAVAAGTLAAILGVLWPLNGVLAPHWRSILRPARARTASATPRRRPLGVLAPRVVLGVCCIGLATLILILRPASAVLGTLALVAAMVCLLPAMYDGFVAAFAGAAHVLDSRAANAAVMELRNSVSRVRSLAIAATAAIAAFGIVSIQGAQANLERGLRASAYDIDASAQVWATQRGESNSFATTPFSGDAVERLRRLAGVQSVGLYRGSFLDWGRRRLWVLGPPSEDATPVPASQLLDGRLSRVAAEIRSGEDVLLSSALAAEHHIKVGESFLLPSPHPIRVRLAGLTTNLGWPPGAIILSASTYARAWHSTAISAYQIHTTPQASPAAVAHRVRAELGRNGALAVETAHQREQRHYAQARAGLSRLTQIRSLLIIAAILAISGALGALLWQRRVRIAYMRVLGGRRPVLWRALCWESTVLLVSGCLIGAAYGLLGQLLLSHALKVVTGFPIEFSIETLPLLWCALLAAGATGAAAVIGVSVVGVTPSTASTTS